MYIHKFQSFLDMLSHSSNRSLMESIKSGYSVIFEGEDYDNYNWDIDTSIVDRFGRDSSNLSMALHVLTQSEYEEIYPLLEKASTLDEAKQIFVDYCNDKINNSVVFRKLVSLDIIDEYGRRYASHVNDYLPEYNLRISSSRYYTDFEDMVNSMHKWTNFNALEILENVGIAKDMGANRKNAFNKLVIYLEAVKYAPAGFPSGDIYRPASKTYRLGGYSWVADYYHDGGLVGVELADGD